MNIAKVADNGQITLPAEIRRILGLKSGDKILFSQMPTGEIVINNASSQAVYTAQQAFDGVAAQLNLSDDNDVQKLVDEVRYGRTK